MECEVCKIIIAGGTHFYVCGRCQKAFHRKKCTKPVDKKLFWKVRRKWICPPCSSSSDVTTLLNYQHLDDEIFNESIDTIEEQLMNSEDNQMDEHSESRNTLSGAKGLSICHVNINSIRNKLDEVKELLRPCKIAVLACTESKLDPHRDTDNMLNIEGYNIVRIDRESNKGGGILIYIRDSFKYECLELQYKMLDNSEYAVIKLEVKGLKPILVVVIYNHPKNPKNKFIEIFENINMWLLSFEMEIVICGDFNLDLLKRSQEGFKLFQCCKEFGLWQLIQGPTRVGISLLDHVYVNKKSNFPIHGHFQFDGSDQDLTFVVRKVNKLKFPAKTIVYRNYKECNWEEIEKCVVPYDFDSTPQNVDQFFWNYNNFVMSCLDKFVPEKKMIVKGKPSPWYTARVANYKKLRDKAKVRALKSQNELDWKNYRRTRNNYNCSISKAKKKYFQTKFQSSLESQSMWETANELTQYKLIKPSPIFKLQIPATESYTEDSSEINKLLAEEFIIEEIYDSDDEKPVNDINEYESNYVYDDESNIKRDGGLIINSSEVLSAIGQLAYKKCKGDLLIPLKVVKELKKTIAIQLAILFTFMCTKFMIPQCCRSAIITALYKGKGSKFIAKNFRPISGLNIYCKLLEKIIFNRLQVRIDSKLNKNQHAYRKGKSCHTALPEFTNNVYKGIDNTKGKVGAVFIDMSKAFDSVNRKLLVKKLMLKYYLEPEYIKILNCYLEGRVVKISGDSNYYVSPCGVPQGSALGPLLYSMFIDDICDNIDISYLLYADDLVIYCDGIEEKVILENLKSSLEKIESWCKLNLAKINYSKTEFMIFEKANDKSSKNKLSELKLGNNVIKKVLEFKYLGIRLDSNLTFKGHYNHVIDKTSNKLSFLYGIKRFLSDNIMVVMLNSYVHSVSDYCLDIWAIQTPNMIQAVQVKIDRFLINYLVPVLAKKYKKQRRVNSIAKLKLNIDINAIREQFNFFTVQERRDIFLLKYMHKLFKNNDLDKLVIQSKKGMPLLSQIAHKSKVFENWMLFRGIKLWNKLPRSLPLKDIGLSVFTDLVKEEIVKSRNDEFYYY